MDIRRHLSSVLLFRRIHGHSEQKFWVKSRGLHSSSAQPVITEIDPYKSRHIDSSHMEKGVKTFITKNEANYDCLHQTNEGIARVHSGLFCFCYPIISLFYRASYTIHRTKVPSFFQTSRTYKSIQTAKCCITSG